MKQSSALVLMLALAAGNVPAATDPAPAAANSAAFDALKKLEGTWMGKAGHGEEKFDVTVVYKVTGGGSALQERLFADTPHEMVTMYHMDGPDVVLTHYCAAGNQPRMKLASSDGTTFSFAFAGGTNIKEGDTHMHDAKIVLVDADRLKAEWSGWKGGKPDHTAVFDLSRKK